MLCLNATSASIPRSIEQTQGEKSEPTEQPSAVSDKVQLWVMATLAFAVFYSSYMVAPLLPAFSKEFAVPAHQLGWLIAGYLIPYGISTLVYGALSDWWGRARTLVALLCFATTTMLLVSFAESWRALIIARILSGLGCGGIVTISLAIVGDRYPYAVQGRPMGRMFGGIAAGIGFGSTLGPILNPLVGWRNEFRLLACVCGLGAVFVFKNACSVISVNIRPVSFRRVLREYIIVLNAPRGGRTMTFIFCNGAFHGGIFAWLGLLLTRRYHLHDAGIGLALAGYGLPGILFGTTIGTYHHRSVGRIRRDASSDVEHYDFVGPQAQRTDYWIRNFRELRRDGCRSAIVSASDRIRL